jgi:hypothetical protein
MLIKANGPPLNDYLFLNYFYKLKKIICKLEKIIEYFLRPKKMLHYIIM